MMTTMLRTDRTNKLAGVAPLLFIALIILNAA